MCNKSPSDESLGTSSRGRLEITEKISGEKKDL